MIEEINSFRTKLKENKIVELLYLIAIFNYSFLICYSSSQIITLPYLLRLYLYSTSLLFTIPKIISQNYTKNEIMLCCFMYCFTAIYSFTEQSIMLFIIPSILIGVKNSDTKTIAKIILLISLSFIIIHTISFTRYYLDNIGTLSTYLRFHRNEEANHMHSYNHNRYGARWVFVYICYMYLTNRNKKRLFKAIMMTALTTLVFALCQSKACLLIMLGLDFYMFFENYKYFSVFVTIFKWFSLFFSTTYSIIIQFLDLDNTLVALLNKLTTTRVELAVYNRENFGIHFFVNNFDVDNAVGYTYDNLILSYEMQYGLFFIICLLIFIYILLFKYKNNKFNTFVMSLMFIMAISQRTPRHITLTLVPLLIMHNFFSIEDAKNKYII